MRSTWRRLRRCCSGVEPRREVGALDEFEGEEEEPLGLAGVEQGHDIRMQQPPGGAGFAQQAALAVLDLLGTADQADGLDRQPAVDLRVLREIDLPHGAGAQESQDAVAAYEMAAVQSVHGYPGPGPSSSVIGRPVSPSSPGSGSPAISPSSPVSTSSRWFSRVRASSARSGGTRMFTVASSPMSVVGNSLANRDSASASMPLLCRKPTTTVASSSLPTILTISHSSASAISYPPSSQNRIIS